MSLPVAHDLPVERGLTVADLEAMPDDHLRRELIDGELYVTPPPIIPHQSSVMAIAYALETYVRAHGGRVWPAPTGVRLSEVTQVEPDVVVLAADSVARMDDHRHLTFAPDLLVEVSSPSTRRLDLIKKRGLYERVGVPEYWFVDLDADVVDVYRLGADGHYGEPETVERGGRLTCSQLPGLDVNVDEVLGPPHSEQGPPGEAR
ncbi:MAG TPA: Uma2 family endonuclease [Nitriliruptorales bacterium]